MAKTFYEAIIGQGGFAGQVFDIAQGPAETQVLDVLLSASGGTNASMLEIDAPVNLISTGALGGARELDITGIEQEGRFFFLSARNSDITTNNLTITATTDINGGGASLVISAASDYIFIHESGGTWRAYQQQLSVPSVACVFRADFSAADWDAGATANSITVVQSGVPGAGEIGPHACAIASSYVVQVFRDSDDRQVGIPVLVNPTTGDITLRKFGLGPDFDGRVIIVGIST